MTSFGQPNLRCTTCRRAYYSAWPEGLVDSPCLRKRHLFGVCHGRLRPTPEFMATQENGWINDGIALAELYANHGVKR